MTAIMSLEALAAELEALRAFVNEHVSKDGYAHLTAESRIQLNMPLVLSEPRAHLAARPASDLEKRMRMLADHAESRGPTDLVEVPRRTLREAADALSLKTTDEKHAWRLLTERDARVAELERAENALRGAYEARGEQIADLERNLAEARLVQYDVDHTELLKRDLEAAEARLAAVARIIHDRSCLSAQTLEQVRQALATPAQQETKLAPVPGLGDGFAEVVVPKGSKL
jgi:hypothetical protein